MVSMGRTTRWVTLLSALVVPGAAAGQTYPAPPDTSEGARVRMGPVSVRPALIIRDVGFDSNVFNESGTPQEDFSATAGAKVDVGMRLNRLIASYKSTYEYIYFEKFAAERGSNRASEGRVDFLLGRIRPHVFGSIADSHERANAEIDARAHRRQSGYGAGFGALVFARTSLTAEYRRADASYADDEMFDGVRLADALNAETETVTGGVELELTPLTSIAFTAEQHRDRFDRSPARDADTRRYGAIVTFQPGALISGRVQVGYRAFEPRSGEVPRMTGVAAAVALAYSFRDQSRVALTLDHDIRYSFADLTPYYLSTAGRLTVTQRIYGPVDVQAVAGTDRLAYEARTDTPGAARRDTLRTLGGGLGYRFGENSRVGINLEHTERSSPVVERRYTRRRVVASLTYGF